MVAAGNVSSLGTGSRTTTGIVPLSGSAASGAASPSGVIDTSGTDWVAFAVTITGSATAQVETSFDNGTTWTPVYSIKGSDSTTTATITQSGLYFGNSIGGQTRINVTAVTGTFAVSGGTTDVTNAPNGTPGSVSIASNPLFIAPTGNSAKHTLASAASTNATSMKTASGNLTALSIFNGSAAAVFFKLFDKASAPTVGTDVPIDVIQVAAGARFSEEYGIEGKRFSSGIAYSITGAVGDLDATAIATGVKVFSTYY